MNMISSKFKILLFCINILTLVGCGSGFKYAPHKVNEAEYHANNKAIIITKMYGRHKPLIGGDSEFRSAYSLAKLDSNYNNINTRHRYRNKEAVLVWPDYEVLMIDPGEYVVEEISYNFGETNYYSSAEGYIPETKQTIYGKFTVNPNEIVYLGDFEIQPKKIGHPVKVLNSDTQAAQYFYKKYPNFSGKKIITRNYTVNENAFPVSLFGEKITQTVYVSTGY